MKPQLFPKEPAWWVWLATAALLVAGLVGAPSAILAAIGLSLLQCLYFVARHRSMQPYAVQIRVAFCALLLIIYRLEISWLFWVPALGTFALVLFGYCLMSRLLSLTPWNRSQPITPHLLWRTFFSPPAASNPAIRALVDDCPGGLCELEARAAQAGH